MIDIFAIVAALIHIYIFFLESVLWGRPRTNRVFGMSSQAAEQNRLLAFNQGFYNLFLAAAAIGGTVVGSETVRGQTLISYALGSMLFASLVLIFSNRKLVRPALVQGLPPLLGLLSLVVGL